MQLLELFEGIVRVPQEQLDKIDTLYRVVKKDLPNIVKELHAVRSTPDLIAAFTPYRGYFSTVNPQTQEVVPVDVKFLAQDKKQEAAYGNMDGTPILLINLAWLITVSAEDFYETIHHELVHATDPKSHVDRDLSKYWQKEYARGSVGPKLDIHTGMENYLTSLHEFDAYSTASLSRLRRYIDAQPAAQQTKIRLELMKKIRGGWHVTPDDDIVDFLSGFGNIFKRELGAVRAVPIELTKLLDNANAAWKKTDSLEGRKQLQVRRNLYRTFLKRAYQVLIA